MRGAIQINLFLPSISSASKNANANNANVQDGKNAHTHTEIENIGQEYNAYVSTYT